MSLTKKRGFAWLAALTMTAILFVCCFSMLDVRYQTNDDACIMRAFMGYETGKPADFSLFIHGFLSKPLAYLGTAFPGIAWFSFMQVGFLFLSLTVISKSIIDCFVNRDRSFFLGVFFAALFLSVHAIEYITHVAFTQTSAFLGAAAAAQMLSIDHKRQSNGKIIWGLLGSVVLLTLACAMRQDAILPMLAFCGLAFVLIVWEHYGLFSRAKRSLKPMLIGALAAFVAIGALAGFRALELQNDENRSYQDWQNARYPVLDYYAPSEWTEAIQQEVGVTPAVVDQLYDWCFLNEKVTTETMQTVLPLLKQGRESLSFGDKTAQIGGLLTSLAEKAPQSLLCFLLPAALSLLIFVSACIRRNGRLALSALLPILLGLSMVFVLSLGGRLPMRAVLMALLPAVVMIFCYLPQALPGSKALTVIICVLCLAFAVYAVSENVKPLQKLSPDDPQYGLSPMADLEESALYEPECLFIYDYSISGADLRMFPDYSEGMPHNVTFWGGWALGSPQSREQFAAFDIDLDHFDPETFLRPDVYLVSGKADQPPQIILDWLHEEVDPGIDWTLYSEAGTVYIYQFYYAF